MKDTQSRNIKITRLDEGITRFDAVLDRIQKLLFGDLDVHQRIVEVRDAIFRLHNQMHNCVVEEFAAPLIEPADLFWNKKEEED
ncbi:MAG: hypothetical protein M3275_14795 [Thermoproteota archaeon]|nr:hypothetical protein [Thermoproteota archaeon]